jgi:hypothetical protein
MDMAGLDLSATAVLPSDLLQQQHDKCLHSKDKADFDFSAIKAEASLPFQLQHDKCLHSMDKAGFELATTSAQPSDLRERMKHRLPSSFQSKGGS